MTDQTDVWLEIEPCRKLKLHRVRTKNVIISDMILLQIYQRASTADGTPGCVITVIVVACRVV